ncbi:MAG: restriction endonuclease [Bacteroidota bacterium]|nr:restriction endonuclease [Bacteroidota bacterium]
MTRHQKIFEFGEPFTVSDRKGLNGFLESIWQGYAAMLIADDGFESESPEAARYQRLLTFDGDCARARNFVGFLQHGDQYIEIYPKVFKNIDTTAKTASNLIIQHLFWWLNYSEKWRLPVNTSNLANFEYDNIPDLIISLFANEYWKTLNESPLALYHEEEAAMTVPRGRINFSRYISSQMGRGNAHILECDYAPLVYDNKLNRAIKYSAQILLKKSRLQHTRRVLEDVLFLLDDVTDEPCTSVVLDQVSLNPAFENYRHTISICRLVLDQQLYSNQMYEQEHWSLLLPMEVIFEDFIAGFIDSELRGMWKVHSQTVGLTLVEEPTKAFRMRHDILLTRIGNDDQQIIVDTKYKLREGDLTADAKKGISQADMYQMTAYAMRRGCKCVLLLYPNVAESCREPDHFKVRSAFDGTEIHVIAAEVPFWSMTNFRELPFVLKAKLNELINLF